MMLISFLIFLIFLVLGMPLAYALGWAGLVGVSVGNFPLSQLPMKMIYSLDSFPLLAIPLFMLAGQLMVHAGLMERLIDLANVIVGRIRGGLGVVTIVASTGLSSISGSSVADAAALGAALGPSLTKAYRAPFGAALVSAASNLGPIIPPSIAMIVYAVVANVSVGALFVAGIVPGILLSLSMILYCLVISRRRGYGITGTSFQWQSLILEIRRSFVILLMPPIIIGGIIIGAFTATEGAGIAVAFAALVGFFITKKLRLRDFIRSLMNAMIIATIIGALITFSSQITYLMTIERVAVLVAEWMAQVIHDPTVFIATVMIVLVFVGMVMEANAALLMLVPIFAPIALTYHIDPVYFGFLFVYNIVVGALTPPVGILLIVAAGIWNIKMEDIIGEVWPLIILQFGILILFIIFPGIVMFLPRLFGY